MKLRTELKISFCAGMLVLLVFPFASVAAFAGDKITQSNDNQTAGNISGDDSLFLGFGKSLGPAAADRCYVSTQDDHTLTGKQSWKLNRWCAAADYDAGGLHEQAARMRCSIPAVAELDYSGTTCVAANTIVAPQSAEVDLTQLVNFLVKRQDAVTAPLTDEIQTLRMDLEKHESDRVAAERRSQQAYQRQRAEEQQYAGNLLDELREFSEESPAKNR